MHRFVVQSFEPAPDLAEDRWVPVICPPEGAAEAVGPGVYRAVVGPTVATLRALGDGWGGWDGPAFELAFPDDAPPEFAKQQAAALWDRFSRAVTRPLPHPPWSHCSAHLLTVETPGWVHPRLGSIAGRA